MPFLQQLRLCHPPLESAAAMGPLAGSTRLHFCYLAFPLCCITLSQRSLEPSSSLHWVDAPLARLTFRTPPFSTTASFEIPYPKAPTFRGRG